jgi:hypothetical protein
MLHMTAPTVTPVTIEELLEAVGPVQRRYKESRLGL